MNNTRGPAKLRVDLAMVDRALAPSRAKAQALILAGEVYSGETRINKAGELILPDQPLSVRLADRYVSRGGTKLEGALRDLPLSVEQLVCVDIGASTGGFTDCLLQHGASRVYAIDVGRGQLAQKLKQDSRVVAREQTNARTLGPGDFPEPIALVVVDVSFIGIAKLLPAIKSIVAPSGKLLAMIKPQFEAGVREVSRGKGVIRDEAVRERVLAEVRSQITAAGLVIQAECDSRLRGPKGNLERFMLCAVSAPL